MEVKIASWEELTRLTMGPLPAHIEIDPTLMGDHEAQRWQSRLNDELSRCGCREAAAALLIGLPSFSIVAFFAPLDGWWQRGAFAIGAASAAMVLAKSIVLLRARRRYRSIVAELAERIGSGQHRSGHAEL